jgi:hypothetical protein
MTCKTYRTPVGGIFACRVGAVCAVLVLAIASCVHAESIIGDPIDWDANAPSNAWDTLGSAATAVETTEGGNDTDWLKISFPGGISEDPGSHWNETAKGDASDLFSGTWDTDYWIEFDFWAEDVLPTTLQIRWSGTAHEKTWVNTITPTAGIGVSETLSSASFGSVSDWNFLPFDTQEEFVADLESIDWIGVYIFRGGTDAEAYGVDNFKLMENLLMVPEPAEYMMLAAALITAFLVMRRQKHPPAPLQLVSLT